MSQQFKANGKLLLTGEYAVLDGAKSLCLPAKRGQKMTVEEIDSQNNIIVWESFDFENRIWFKTALKKEDFSIESTNHPSVANRLVSILNVAKTQNSTCLTKGITQVKTYLQFPNDWGLGSSSTLLKCIADWTQVDSFYLLKHTFGGSGYDLACARENSPLVYQLKNDVPSYDLVEYHPNFAENLFFVHLNQKQDSREGISAYKKQPKSAKLISEITELTQEFLHCSHLNEFENLINIHENLISNHLKIQRIKKKLFPDYPYEIKSLGAWGGDFVLITTRNKDTSYFKTKGYHTIVPYKTMVY